MTTHESVSRKPQEKGTNIPWWVKSIMILAATATSCYKIIITDFNMAFDFTSFLSLALALFSVLLAAMFYFKATDTSNSFYDNTYKFTQDIAQLLVKIESGFGEKLTHLDDSYRGMRNRFDSLPNGIVQKTEEAIEENEESVKKLSEDMNNLLQDLLAKTGLEKEKQEAFLQEIRKKEQQLSEAHKEIYSLRNRLEKSKMKDDLPLTSSGYHHFHTEILPKLSANKTLRGVERSFRRLINESHRGMQIDFEESGLINEEGELTEKGLAFLLEEVSNYKS